MSSKLLENEAGTSNIVATLVLIAVAVAGGAFAYTAFRNLSTSATGNVDLRVMNLTAQNAGGETYLSATVKNTGTRKLGHTTLTVGTGANSVTMDIGCLDPGETGSAQATANPALVAGKEYPVRISVKPPSLMEGLVAWYRFDSGSGNTLHDRSGNGNDGTLKGDPTWVDGWTGDGALKFDGSGDYVALDMFYQDGDSLSNFTVLVQYKTSVSGGWWASNWSFLDFDRSEWFNVYIRGGNGKLGFSGSDGVNDYYDIYADTASNDGTGHRGAVVYSSDRDFVKFYLDGHSDGTETYANVDPISDWKTRYGFIGDGSEASSFDGNRNGFYFEGTIDEIMFFNRALSPDEIKTLTGDSSILTRAMKIRVRS